MHMVLLPLFGGNVILVVPANTTYGRNNPSAIDETIVTCFLYSILKAYNVFIPLFSHVISPTIGTRCIFVWSLLTIRFGGML